MNIKTPKGWRKGQTLVNFLAWVHLVAKNDPFYIEDRELDKLFKEFLKLYGAKK